MLHPCSMITDKQCKLFVTDTTNLKLEKVPVTLVDL